jgi:hypothetical protein
MIHATAGRARCCLRRRGHPAAPRLANWDQAIDRGGRYRWVCDLSPGAYATRAYATDIAGNTQRKVGSAPFTVL